MSIKRDMYLEQVVIKNKDLPSLLREVADWVEKENVSLWDVFIDSECDESGEIFARLIISGFVNLPNTASTRLGAGAADPVHETVAHRK